MSKIKQNILSDHEDVRIAMSFAFCSVFSLKKRRKRQRRDRRESDTVFRDYYQIELLLFFYVCLSLDRSDSTYQRMLPQASDACREFSSLAVEEITCL